MKNLLRTALILTLISTVAFGMIPRVAVIPVPEDSLNNGGVGNMIAGQDIDGDGAKEIYLVNDNWKDGESELVPRIYKLEREVGDTMYNIVWSATPQDYQSGIIQNTWPTFAITDLDDDGKMELTWGIVNFTNATNTNPYRIWVYEHAGGDNFGVYDETSGKWMPNSVWDIADANIRPFSWEIYDINDDGIDEIIFAGRTPDMRIGICSVDNIPDDGDSSETWFMEYSSADITNYGGDNKWDVAIIGNTAYLFDEAVISKVTCDNFNYTYTELSPLPGGLSRDAAQVCDVNGDEVFEIITAEYKYGADTRNIWLLQEDSDTLKRTPLFDIYGEDYLDGGNIVGGDQGDIDGDGNVDFIFGSNASGYPNGMIFRVEYLGSGDITDPLNWELTIADTSVGEYSNITTGMWSIVDVANVDDDSADEIIFTSSTPYTESDPNVSFPIYILDTGDYTTDVKYILEPTSFELGKAYPNPFNPATIIPFTLEKSGMVTLIVFNVKGERVSTLISNDRMESGHHNVMFDASDLASGVYVYQLKVDNTMRAAKMVLNK